MCWPLLWHILLVPWGIRGSWWRQHPLLLVEKAQQSLPVSEERAAASIYIVNFAAGLGVQRTLQYYRDGSASRQDGKGSEGWRLGEKKKTRGRSASELHKQQLWNSPLFLKDKEICMGTWALMWRAGKHGAETWAPREYSKIFLLVYIGQGKNCNRKS